MQKIVKAEILLSRKCDMSCKGCGMVTGEENSRSISEWQEGLRQAANLGCEFFAFYGAEPFLEYKKLRALVYHCEKELKVPCTVITNGNDTHFEEKLQELYNVGLRSLTMSYTPISFDKHTARKSEYAKDMLVKWKNNFKDVRDAAAVVTITPEVLPVLPDIVKTLTAKGIWTFFDFFHPDRNQEGSKCKGFFPEMDCFGEYDYVDFLHLFQELTFLKTQGYLIHPSEDFFNQVLHSKRSGNLWNCADSAVFPSWITIDCDGFVRPCDDFHKDGSGLDMLELEKGFDVWGEIQRSIVKENCPGCVWCTHIQAHSIKQGELNIENYVHK